MCARRVMRAGHILLDHQQVCADDDYPTPSPYHRWCLRGRKHELHDHRCTSRGDGGGAAAPESGKAISFQANATFLSRSQQVKMKTNISFCTVFI